MPIGGLIPMTENPPQAPTFFLALILFLGVPENKHWLQDQSTEDRSIANSASEVLWIQSLLA